MILISLLMILISLFQLKELLTLLTLSTPTIKVMTKTNPSLLSNLVISFRYSTFQTGVNSEQGDGTTSCHVPLIFAHVQPVKVPDK